MKIIRTPAVPTPAGHYSQAVEQNGFLFLSGMLPAADAIDPAKHDFRQQCEAVFRQCQEVLRAADCSYGDVVQATAYLVGVENWGLFNEIYASYLGQRKPARAVVPVPALHHGYLIELQLIAFVPAQG